MTLDRARIGELNLSKGSLNSDIQINIWDKVKVCTGIHCKFALLCPYKCSEQEPKGEAACLIERKYLTANLEPFMQLLERANDQFLMQWVGMHLIPLYYDLCQLKMEKLLIGDEIIYDDSKGQKRIHPIFEEIRKVHREIFAIWRTTGLKKIAEDAGFFQQGGTIIPDRDPDIHGTGADYDDMARGA